MKIDVYLGCCILIWLITKSERSIRTWKLNIKQFLHFKNVTDVFSLVIVLLVLHIKNKNLKSIDCTLLVRVGPLTPLTSCVDAVPPLIGCHTLISLPIGCYFTGMSLPIGWHWLTSSVEVFFWVGARCVLPCGKLQVSKDRIECHFTKQNLKLFQNGSIFKWPIETLLPPHFFILNVCC